jgi:SAM-dependent methyltransferase
VAYAPYLAIMRRRARAQANFIQLRNHSIRSAIDVGCGVGALVADLTHRGIDAIGFDSDAGAVTTGRKVFAANIHQGHLERVGGDQRRDLLCLSHVVEHFADPVRDLEKLLEVVCPGGFLFVEVPQCSPWMFDQRVPTESHLGFFTLRSLKVLARRLSLRVRSIENCGPILQRYYEQRAFASAPPRRWESRLRSITRRLSPLGTFLTHFVPVRTEFDGCYESYSRPGDESRLWIRALLQRPE